MTDAARFVRSVSASTPGVGIVLGSGLGAFTESLSGPVRFAYGEIPGLPVSTAIGHRGELVLGGIEGTAVAVMSGRFHLYEGYRAKEVTAGVRLLRELGVRRLILTNAAGGIHPAYAPGSLVMISDHINLQGANPLCGANDDLAGPRFPDMTEAYPAGLRRLARDSADQLGIDLKEGVYAGVLGPSYETPAEIRYLKAIGADLVGMSTISETIMANYLGMEVLGISCVTNVAAGLSGQKLDHAEVLAAGRRVADTLERLLFSLVPKLA